MWISNKNMYIERDHDKCTHDGSLVSVVAINYYYSDVFLVCWLLKRLYREKKKYENSKYLEVYVQCCRMASFEDMNF